MKNTTKIDKDSKKILIIGANGFLGKNILYLYKNNEIKNQNIQLIAADLKNTNIPIEIPFYHIDITKPEDSINKIVKIFPDVILLTAGVTNVDQCEIDKKFATKINVDGVYNILRACEKVESKLIFMSSDFVFDGLKNKGYYNEKDIPNPQSHYGKTKYEAELAIINSEINYLICRTAVLYGWNQEKINFITWVLNKLNHKEKISIVTNQINNATFVINLSQILLKLVEKDTNGIYHTAGDGALSRYEMAVKCAEFFNYNNNLITPIENLKQKAKRPKNAGLDISKLKKLIGSELEIYSLDDGLNYMKNHRLE
jgi:dTDP-4-dehydrorhamnose reductase